MAPPPPPPAADRRDGRDGRDGPDRPVRLLFVCWGNICRSPTAAAIMRRVAADAGLADRVVVDSAGTSGEHAGDLPDRRALAEADRRGIDLRDQRARRLGADDWHRADLVLVADATVERRVLAAAPDAAARAKVHRMTAFGPDAGTPDVPDPYYGGPDGFQHVYDLLARSCAGLLAHLFPDRQDRLDPERAGPAA